MSTGSENGHPTLPSTPLSSRQQMTSERSTQIQSGLSNEILSLLKNADEKTLREVMVHCSNALNSSTRSNTVLNTQFSVVHDVLSRDSVTTPTASNEAGTYVMSPSSADIPDGPSFLDNLTEELETLNLREKCGQPGNRKVASQWIVLNPNQTNLPAEDMQTQNFPVESHRG